MYNFVLFISFTHACASSKIELSILYVNMEQRTYKLYLYIHDTNNPRRAVLTTKDMMYVGEATAGSVIREEVFRLLNAQLRQFLINNDIFQFIPVKAPSYDDESDGSVSVCYYHHKVVHDIVYSDYPDLVNIPAMPLYMGFEDKYEMHGLDGWYDPRSNTTVDEDAGPNVHKDAFDDFDEFND